MKTLRIILYLLIVTAGTIAAIWFIYNNINPFIVEDVKEIQNIDSNNSQNVAENTDLNSEQNTKNLDTDNPTKLANSEKQDISIATPDELKNSYIQATGVVKSSGIANVTPMTAGTVKKVNYREGDYVKAGSTIIELTGSNLSEHQAVTQLRVAETNLANAKTSLANLQKSSEQTMKTASLQLQSARNQTAAWAYDLDVIAQNRKGINDALSIAYDSLNAIESKNSRDELKTMRDIDNLIFKLNNTQDDRARTKRQLQDIQDLLEDLNKKKAEITEMHANEIAAQNNMEITNAGTTHTSTEEGTLTAAANAAAVQSGGGDTSPPLNEITKKIAAAETQKKQLEALLSAQEKGIEELYNGIEAAKYGLNTMQDGASMSRNQILGQIAQSENQAQVLDLTSKSTRAKLGYSESPDGNYSDALRLAEQAYKSTEAQLKSALDSATIGVKLAELGVESARNQVRYLQILAPFDGIITSLPYTAGQTVGPQQIVAEIIKPQSFELEVGIDISNAERISAFKPAIIELGGRSIEVPIKSVGLKVDSKTHQVKIKLGLPNIFFKLNQNIKVSLPVTTESSITSQSPNKNPQHSDNSIFIPLDAVIIGTENQFVYIEENGRAKKTDVKIGQIIGDRIEILSGIPDNARIIVKGARQLVDGQEISVIE